MDRVDGYKLVSDELNAILQLSFSEVVRLIENSPVSKSFEISGELVEVETCATWQNAEHTKIAVDVIANGPSYYIRRVEKSLVIAAPKH